MSTCQPPAAVDTSQFADSPSRDSLIAPTSPAGQTVKFARTPMLALEAFVIFGGAARVVALHVQHQPAFDLHARSIHVERFAAGRLAGGIDVIFSTRASAWRSSSSQRFFSTSPRS